MITTEVLRNMTQIELADLIADESVNLDEVLFKEARRIREERFGNRVYLRGLIEVSSYCKNDCLYCGLRRSNKKATRYRLSEKDIMRCCEVGYDIGFRTFVLQGGEDPYFTDDLVSRLLCEIKGKYPDVAVTLSLGERSRESYKALKASGADRYLLRHESADETHYSKLHPSDMSLSNRKKCLFDLKELGFQTGAGFLVGSPYQTCSDLACDLVFLRELMPHMVGIGPFIPHHDTPFANMPKGRVETTLRMIALTRIMLPHATMPATTALGSAYDNGRELGLLVGANVVMPNLSPFEYRDAYSLYDGKLYSGSEAAEGVTLLTNRLEKAGFTVDMSRGDVVM